MHVCSVRGEPVCVTMEMRCPASDIMPGAMKRTVRRPSSVIDSKSQREKREVKLTAKGLADKLDRLQTHRKSLLNKASNIKGTIRSFIEHCECSKVQEALNDLVQVCHDVKCVHESLLMLLPAEECEKHSIWFKAKMLGINDCIAEANTWISGYCKPITEINTNFDDLGPSDSASNIGNPHLTNNSVCGRSNISSTSSAHIIARAEHAALEAKAAVLKERHALDEQEEQLERRKAELRRRKEQLDLDSQIAAANARLAVLRAAEEEEGLSELFVCKKKVKSDFVPFKKLTSEYQPTKPTLISKPREEMRMSTAMNIQHGVSQHLSCDGGDILAIMQKQNELTAALVQQQLALSLPPRNIPTFDGDLLSFRSFMKAFEQGVEKKAGQAECLYYLGQFTRGQPHDLVQSCQHMAPEEGYAKAKGLLYEHFGNPYRITSAYVEKALTWQPIRTEDAMALQDYSLFLRGCCNAMKDLKYMEELDLPQNMKAVVSKLPFKLREQWRTTAHETIEETNRRPTFEDLVTFIERCVKILSDPIFGNIQDPQTLSRSSSQSRNRVNRKVFATTVDQQEVMEQPEISADGCIFCAGRHSLNECQLFKSKQHKNKIEWLKEERRCFACLCVGHISRECEQRLACTTCNQMHPTVLHTNRRSVHAVQEHPEEGSKTCGHTGAGAGCALAILPVKIKAPEGNIVETYAFLDPGSSATFCSEQLMQRLQSNGKRTKFLLRTMGHESEVPAFSLCGLEVSNIENNDFYPLPEVLTQKRMPVSCSSLVTSQYLLKFPHLSGVYIPNIDANVELLIGTDAPRLVEPQEVIKGDGRGPYAVRTVLGWVVSGPLIDTQS